MALKTDSFENVGESGPLTKWQKEVKTPLPEAGESGFKTETNRKVVYELGDDDDTWCYIMVSKVSDIGWRLKRYDADGEIDGFMEDYIDSEEAAHNKAKDHIEAILDERSE